MTKELVLDIPPGDFAGYIFDCDGTLADTMPLHYAAWLAALREHQADHTFPESVFYGLGGVSSSEIISRLNQQHGLSMDPVLVSHRKEALFLDMLEKVDVIQPVTDFARARAAEGFPVSVVSGGLRHIVLHTLELIGMAELFPIVITPEDVKHGKPAPDMFLLAAERMGVAPERCLVFEDGASGIEGARAARMGTVFVASHPYGTPA